MAEQAVIPRGWDKLSNVPIHVMYPKPLLIGDSIYFFPNYMHSEVAYLDNYCNEKYVKLKEFSPNCYKYDTIKKKFTIFTKFPKSVTSMYNTVNYDPNTKEVIYIGGTHDVFAKLKIDPTCQESKEEEQEPTWNLDSNFKGRYETTGPLPASIYIDSTFHMIGGHNSYYHEVYDPKQNRMKPVYKFDYRLKDRSLIYIKRSNQLIMFGGCRWTEDFKQSVRFRYIDQFLICDNPNDLKNIKWEIKKEWRLPYLMMGFGYLVINDEKLLIFGGRKSGGNFMNECWMFDMVKNQWWKSSLSIPKPGKYHAILVKGGEDRIELFQFGHPAEANGAHFGISLSVLLNSMESVDELPQRETTKEDEENQKVYTMNKNKYTKLSFNELANEVVNNKDLSKNMRKKMLKKLKKKQEKYNKPFVPQKEQIEEHQNGHNKGGQSDKVAPALQVVDNNQKDNDSTYKFSVVGVIGAVAMMGAMMFYYKRSKPKKRMFK